MFSFNHMVQFQTSFVSPEHLFHQGLAKIQLLAPRPGASCRIWPLDHKRNDQDLARVPGLPKSGKPITVRCLDMENISCEELKHMVAH